MLPSVNMPLFAASFLFPGLASCQILLSVCRTVYNDLYFALFLPEYEHFILRRLCCLSLTSCKVGPNYCFNHLSVTTCQTYSVSYHQYNVTACIFIILLRSSAIC